MQFLSRSEKKSAKAVASGKEFYQVQARATQDCVLLGALIERKDELCNSACEWLSMTFFDTL